MSLRILCYDYTYNELKVESDTKQYTYAGVSPYLYNKLRYYISQNWIGKAWRILRRLKPKKENQDVNLQTRRT